MSTEAKHQRAKSAMFQVRDSGRRQTFESGMVRDTTEGKRDYTLALDGPMLDRWAEHLTKGARKYDARNWMLADGDPELERFRQSAIRHMLQWLRGDTDEDHAAAVFFNINGAEYVADQLTARVTAELLMTAHEAHAERTFTAPTPGTPATYQSAVDRVEQALGLRKGSDKCCMSWPACEGCTAPVDGGPE